MPPVIELKKVSKRYDTGPVSFYAVRDVNLQIEAGEFVAIMGPSGSGKSTMMHLMGLLDEPTSGDILVDGISTSLLTEKSLSRLRNQKLGFVFQSYNLLSRTSALENIALPLWYAKQPAGHARAQAARAMKRVGMDPASKGRNHPNQLSGGQQQRIAIARAIVTEPSMILADEPTGNLDSHSTDEILSLFQSLNDEGTTVVIVTHEDYVGEHAKRIIRFRDGRIEREERVERPRRAKEGASTWA
ncbi:ABC transporter ATP-binding protein [Alicyclobacillus sp. SO9]|uniref:ABC transporter ATP-binding protein n=1 Tax=Alicyclobacillus sp. SO9 TaxID=2665646 RepID=UPI0018E7B2FD|nr:ABC transporter ATP-binding protein [Alicyclobacillus sp. SO9]QQE77820.1 ABC transporter ATP-binding protein [Alicyclobacillus sp. SO9]